MSNKRAILPGKFQKLVVDKVDIIKPKKGELLVKTHAVATNPVDWKIQKYGIFIEHFPFVLGSDIAGTVEEVGEQEASFKKGDRVWCWSPCLSQQADNRYGGFQEYTTIPSVGTGRIPDQFSFEQGACLGLPLATAIAGLYVYNKDIPRPSTLEKLKTPLSLNAGEKVLFVSGGASAVGAAAVQFGALAGLNVFATSSPKNFDLVRSFGAVEVFDYKDKDIASKVKAALSKDGKQRKVAWAYDAVSEANTLATSVDVLEGTGALITVLSPPQSFDPKSCTVSSILASVLYMPANAEVLHWYVTYISEASSKGVFIPLQPEVKGHSVEDAQAVLDYHASGQVSAAKPILKLV